MRVLIVQSHPLPIFDLAMLLKGASDITVVGVSSSGGDALKATVEHHPDVVLMDYRLPDISGPSAAETILAASPASAIVFHSADESQDALLDAVNSGAIAYLTKDASAEQILGAVRRAAQGHLLIPAELFVRAISRRRDAGASREREKLIAELTPRELEVLQLLAAGLDTGEVSDRLGIAPHTVEWHVRHLIEKLKVHSKLQAVIAAARLGLIELTGPQ